jgi:hypothetical protein
MTEMTMPEVSPSPRKNLWKTIVPVAIIVILCCLCLVVTGVLAYLGSQGKGPLASLQDILPPIGRSIAGDWAVYYDWSCTGNYSGPASMTFLSDSSFSITEGGSYSYGSWSMSGKNVDFIFDEYPNSHYIGAVNADSTSMEGTMTNSDGGSGCWYASR